MPNDVPAACLDGAPVLHEAGTVTPVGLTFASPGRSSCSFTGAPATSVFPAPAATEVVSALVLTFQFAAAIAVAWVALVTPAIVSDALVLAVRHGGDAVARVIVTTFAPPVALDTEQPALKPLM